MNNSYLKNCNIVCVHNCYFSEVRKIEKLVQKDEDVKWGARRKRNSCQPGRLHKHTLGRSRQTQPDKFSHWTHTHTTWTTINLCNTRMRTNAHPAFSSHHSCKDIMVANTYLAQPKAISLYLLLTATQVPSVTSAAQTPCSCCTHVRNFYE